MKNFLLNHFPKDIYASFARYGLRNIPLIIVVVIVLPILISCSVQNEVGNGGTNTNVAPCVYSEPSYTSSDLQWLTESLIGFDSEESINFNSEAFKNLYPYFSGIHIFGLGESAHGSHELIDLRIAFTKFLVTKLNYRIIALEIPMPYIFAINEYINGGKGDLPQLLNKTGSWTINTKEMLAFITWAKEYNDGVNTQGKITIVGYDIPLNDPESEIVLVNEYFHEVKPEIEKDVTSKLGCINTDKNSYLKKTKSDQTHCRKEINSIVGMLESDREYYVGLASVKRLEFTIHSLRSLLQLEAFYSSPTETAYSSRDQSMAENIEWIYEVFGEKNIKVALWGHNTHVGKNVYANTNSGTLGFRMDQKYGDGYFVTGSTFYDGRINAIPLTANHQVDIPPRDSYETFFSLSHLPAFFIALDTKKTPTWFSSTHCLRNIGAFYDDNAPQQFWDVDRLGDEYDSFLFVKTSSPTVLLGDGK